MVHIFCYVGQLFIINVVYTMGTEHALATSCPVFVCATLHGEWTHARRRPYGPVYINLPGPCLRLTRPSEPVYNAATDSSVCAASDAAIVFSVCLSRPGLHQHTGPHRLHELFIGYEQVTAWVARFSFKLEAKYHQPPFALDGSMGRRTSRRHYSLVKFKSPVGRNHWPSC